ncbi:MAG: hypothetical protein ACJ79A_20105, partial [Gemmatimonadaceae bacterium]
MNRRMHRLVSWTVRLHGCALAASLLAPSLLAPSFLAAQTVAAERDVGGVSGPRAERDTAGERRVQKTFFVKRDLVTSGIAVASSAAVSAFDLR